MCKDTTIRAAAPETKTTKEWFDTLPEPYREQALMNTPYGKWRTPRGKLDAALYYAFIWSDSPEGDEYWRELRRRADAGEFDVIDWPSLKVPVDLPEGYSHWEYRGKGWRGRGVRFVTCQRLSDGSVAWDSTVSPLDDTAAYPDLHYWEAVPLEEPPVPAPEGHHWELRGRRYHGPKGPTYILKLDDPNYWGVPFGPHEAASGLNGVYWEAVKDPAPPAVVGYRILNPDDVIQKGDEVLGLEGAPGWSPMLGSFGQPYVLVMRDQTLESVWRRPITSYEDATPTA